MTAFATPANPSHLLPSVQPLHSVPRNVCQTCTNRSNPSANFQTASKSTPGRILAAATAAAVIALTSFTPAFAASISAERCTSGEGPGCEAAAAESPIIRELLEKSRANKAKNEKATLEEYWERGYGSYFSFGYNKELIKDEGGKWSLQDPNDMRSQIERKIADAIRARMK